MPYISVSRGENLYGKQDRWRCPKQCPTIVCFCIQAGILNLGTRRSWQGLLLGLPLLKSDTPKLMAVLQIVSKLMLIRQWNLARNISLIQYPKPLLNCNTCFLCVFSHMCHAQDFFICLIQLWHIKYLEAATHIFKTRKHQANWKPMTVPGHIRELRLQGKALLWRHRGIQEVRAEVQSPKPEAFFFFFF